MSARLAPVALVTALLVATSAAFVVTEKLKLTRNPIVGPTVDKTFSPVCDCENASAAIRFRLRLAEKLGRERLRRPASEFAGTPCPVEPAGA